MRIMKRIIVFSTFPAFVVIAALLYFYSKYSSFRSAPDLRTFSSEMSSPDIFSPISRYLIFKPGSDIYATQLADWLHAVEYRPAKRDAQNMHSFLSGIHPAQLANLTKTFSKNKDVILPHVKNAWFPDGKPCLFSRIPSDGEEADAFYTDEKWGIPYAAINDHQLKQRILDCIRNINADESDYFPLELLPENGAEAEIVVESMVENNNFPLMARATSLKTELSKMASRRLSSRIGDMKESDVQSVQYMTEKDAAVQSAIFRRFVDENENIAMESLRNLIRAGHHKEAQDVAAALLETQDSSIRKDVIVVLARNDLPLGRKHVDEAFVGPSERREMFFSHNDYVRSRTAVQYTKISGHDYVQTGKHFPTVYCTPPSENEVDELREFISSHPWFPGTDDAHLRLVSRLYLDGDYDQAEAELAALNRANYPDTDAKTLVKSARDLIERGRLGDPIPPSPEEWYARTSRTESCHGGKSNEQ
jgi:hypothetical protein